MQRLALPFLMMIGLSGAAFAADTPATGSDTADTHGGRHGFREACSADIQTYCSTSKSRDERHACVQANKDKFSGGCKAFMAAHPRHQSSTPPAAQ
ncbi:MAG: hypothetical protein GC190_11445 [Alphaproteobacteria bacterium]|nr:hypothetical protein [Alphaproteobacteria bacterium]